MFVVVDGEVGGVCSSAIAGATNIISIKLAKRCFIFRIPKGFVNFLILRCIALLLQSRV